MRVTAGIVAMLHPSRQRVCNMKDRFFVASLVLWVFSTEITASTSLIERIRQREENDKPRGLDLTADGWVHVPQSLQDVLSSIDDKLRSLDTFGYTLKLAKFDFSLEQLVRRLDGIETKLGRLETKFDVRMEKVEEVVVSKDLKEEFSNEYLSRRMDFLNDKLNNKAAYLDAKIDLKMEGISTKLELLERDLHNLVDDILEKLVKSDDRHSQFETSVINRFAKVDDVVTSVNDLRLFLKEELVNILQKQTDKTDRGIEDVIGAIQQNGKEISTASDIVTRTSGKIDVVLRDMKSGFANISAKCDADETGRSLAPPCESSNNAYNRMIETNSMVQKSIKSKEEMFRKLEANIEVYAKKTIASTQEVRRISEENKSLLLKLMETSNRSRDIIRQEFRDRLEHTSRCENKLSLMGSELDKKVAELKSTVDTSFATLLVAQNTFISSCRRIQQEEARVYEILEQIVYEMRNTSAAGLYKINKDILQSRQELDVSIVQLLEALFAVGNNTIGQIEKYQKSCARYSLNSASSHSKDAEDQTVVNQTQIYDSESTNAEDSYEDSNDFQEIINNDTELGLITDNNGTISVINDYESDYPITDTDYSDVQQDLNA